MFRRIIKRNSCNIFNFTQVLGKFCGFLICNVRNLTFAEAKAVNSFSMMVRPRLVAVFGGSSAVISSFTRTLLIESALYITSTTNRSIIIICFSTINFAILRMMLLLIRFHLGLCAFSVPVYFSAFLFLNRVRNRSVKVTVLFQKFMQFLFRL